MTKFRVIASDPPWEFGDELKMSDVKRGASSQYPTLTIKALKELPVEELAEDDAVLVLWCPSSLLAEGLSVMETWGFRQTQTHIWVKTKIAPLRHLQKELVQAFKKLSAVDGTQAPKTGFSGLVKGILSNFSLDKVLAFGLGRLFRQTHEVALVGVRGKIYEHLENRSQRSVHFHPVTKHSAKPEALQDRLETMFPQGNRLEMFARRDRPGWVCVGDECPSTVGEDIRDSLDRLKQ
jgi:N6-adenosine-specific RNA methylase IME4